MTANQEISRYSSFLVRLWQEREVDTSAAWRGEVESIQTGQTRQFADLESLFDFFDGYGFETVTHTNGIFIPQHL